MSGGNAEKNRPIEKGDIVVITADYYATFEQGECVEVLEVRMHTLRVSSHRAFGIVDMSDVKVKESPLATASAELAEKGTPLVADIKPVSDIDTEQVTDPAHYAKSYPQGIEVYQMIEVILEKLGGHLTPYDQWLFGNILKYRLRAGFKDDGNDGMQDLKKAMRCREMMSE